MITLYELKTIDINIENIPFYHKQGAKNGNTYVKFGDVKNSNNPYAYTEEKRVANKICRVLCPNKTLDNALVISDDGTVWKVWFSNFKYVKKINVIK